MGRTPVLPMRMILGSVAGACQGAVAGTSRGGAASAQLVQPAHPPRPGTKEVTHGSATGRMYATALHYVKSERSEVPKG